MLRPAIVAALAILLACANALAQTTPPNLDNWSPPPLGAEQEEDDSSWTAGSNLRAMSWPEAKWPRMKLPSLWRSSEPGEPSRLMTPVVRAQSATRAVATRTRDAWTGTVDRVKMRLPGTPDQETVATTPPRRRFWSSWFSEDKPATDQPSSVPELMAREPGTVVR